MKRFLSVILSLALLLTVVTVSANTAPEKTGMSFSGDWYYRTDKIMEKTIMTLEATVKLPEGYTGAGGVIYGCERYAGLNRFEYRLQDNGVPQLYIVANGGKVYNYNFSKVNIPTGEWVHLAIVRDTESDVMKCYVNGEYKQSVAMLANPEKHAAPYVIGGNYTWENAAYFKGEINSVKVYSDIRTAKEINSDINTVDYDNLEAYYDLSEVNIGQAQIKDLTNNGYDARYEAIWMDEMPEVEDYDYSMIVIGDQQKMTAKAPQDVIDMHQYIVDFGKDENNKLKYVFNLGDLTDFDTDEEYAVYEECLDMLNNAGVDHSFVLGNHETKTNFNSNITYEEYGEAIGVDGTYDGTLLNYYKLVEIGGIKYLMLAFEYCPNDDILAWADSVVEQYSDYNVIILTHYYLGYSLYDSAEVNTAKAADIANNGVQMWNKFIRKHENISLVLGGHSASTVIPTVTQTGDNGNTVTSMMINPQDFDYYLLYDGASEHGTGMIAQLFFSNDGKTVQVRQYSTIRQKWFRSEASFSLTLDLIDDNNLSGADFG